MPSLRQDSARLLDLIGRKHDCLSRLRELGSRQHSLIESGDMTQLLGVLAEKQRAIGSLQQLEQDLNPFRDDDPDARRWSSPAERVRCATLAEQASHLLAEVLDCEKRCEDSLRRRRDAAAEQLAVIQSAGLARDAYADCNEGSVSTLDLTVET